MTEESTIDSLHVETFQSTYEAYASKMVSYFIARKGCQRPMAEDIVQQAWAIAWEHRHRFEERASLRTWVTVIAINVYKDYHSPNRKHGRNNLAVPLEEDLRTEESSVESDLFFEQLLRLIWYPKMRVVAARIFQQGETIKEASEAAGIAESTARNWVYRTLRDFKRSAQFRRIA